MTEDQLTAETIVIGMEMQSRDQMQRAQARQADAQARLADTIRVLLILTTALGYATVVGAVVRHVLQR